MSYTKNQIDEMVRELSSQIEGNALTMSALESHKTDSNAHDTIFSNLPQKSQLDTILATIAELRRRLEALGSGGESVDPDYLMGILNELDSQINNSGLKVSVDELHEYISAHINNKDLSDHTGIESKYSSEEKVSELLTKLDNMDSILENTPNIDMNAPPQ